MHARFDVLSHPADFLHLEYYNWDDYFSPLVATCMLCAVAEARTRHTSYFSGMQYYDALHRRWPRNRRSAQNSFSHTNSITQS